MLDFTQLVGQLSKTDRQIEKLIKRLDDFDNTVKHLIMSVDANTKALNGKVPDHK